MNNYSRLTEKERAIAEKGIRERKSIREIGRLTARSASSISREIKRNGGYLWYYAAKANSESNKGNRLGFSKIERKKTA